MYSILSFLLVLPGSGNPDPSSKFVSLKQISPKFYLGCKYTHDDDEKKANYNYN